MISFKVQTVLYFLLGLRGVWTEDDEARQYPGTVHPSSISNILNKLFINYDNRVQPGYGGENSHLNVSVKLYTLPWFEMEEMKMEYSFTMILIQTWMDERLSFNHESISSIMLNGEHRNKVWIPDTYIKNERQSHLHDITFPNEFIKIQSNGQISLETRTSVTVGCNYDIDTSAEFPFDSHLCMITFESFKGANGEILYHWDNEFEGSGAELHPTAICRGFYVSKVTEYQEVVIRDVDIGGRNFSKWYTPRLSVEILFERALQPYITSVYIPLIIFTSISILSLGVLNVKICSFLNFFNIAFVNIFMAMRFSSQNMIWTTKSTALDKYLNMCTFFIICCAIVNIIVLYMENSKSQNDEDIELRDVPQTSTENPNTNFESHNSCNSSHETEYDNLFNRHSMQSFSPGSPPLKNKIRSWLKKIPEAVSLFCEFSSWAFSGAFVVANALYWAKHF